MVAPSIPLYHSYIDTRSLTALTHLSDPLPLLTTLRLEDQAAVTHFLRLQDRHMALAAALLKYTFIHRTAMIPWDEVSISRTPPPHKRPFWDPGTAHGRTSSSIQPRPEAASAVEFNVSHQAGLVALAGCATSTAPSSVMTTPDGPIISNPTSTSTVDPESPRIGIDITCVSERPRSPSHIETPAEFSSWVDIFTDVFSAAEVHDMKTYEPTVTTPDVATTDHFNTSPVNALSQKILISTRLRRFYTFFALKEAYVKMTGEALLAGWLKELEFRNVSAPPEVEGHADMWSQVISDVQVWLRGVKVPGLKVEIVGFGTDFILALVARGLGVDGHVRGLGDDGGEGGGEGGGQGQERALMLGHGLKRFDIEADIRPCAEGRCSCFNADN